MEHVRVLLIGALTFILSCSSDVGNSREPVQVPEVEPVDGFLSDGESFVLTGSGFGAKIPVAPWIWDDFERGAPNSTIQNWELWYDHDAVENPPPQYSTDDPATGGQSARLHFENHQQHNALLRYHESLQTAMFGAIKFKTVKTGGFDSRNIKLFRLMGRMEGDPVHGNPVIAWGGADSLSPLDPDDPEPTDSYSGWNASVIPATGCEGPSPMYGESDRNIWHSYSNWIHLSSSDGEPDGLVGMRLDGSFEEKSGVTICEGSTSEGLDEVAIGLYLAHDRHLDTDEDGDIDNDDEWVWVQSDYLIYVDDIYIDVTLQRVEICDGPVWEGANCEVQIPHTTWNDNMIELTAHQGRLSSSESLYLFVVNEDGVAGEPVEVRFE